MYLEQCSASIFIRNDNKLIVNDYELIVNDHGLIVNDYKLQEDVENDLNVGKWSIIWPTN